VPSAQRHVKEIWAKRRKGERKMKKLSIVLLLVAILMVSTTFIAIPLTKCEEDDPVRPLLFVNGKWTPFTDSPGYNFGEFPCNTEWLTFTVNVTWFQPPKYDPPRWPLVTTDVVMNSSISGTVFSPSTFQLNNYDHQYEMVSVSVPIAGLGPNTYYAWIRPVADNAPDNPMYFYFTKTQCIQPTAAVSIVKTANVTMAHVGDVIEYSFNVTNTGKVELTGVYIDDNLTGRIDIGDLGSGEWTVVTATHTVSGSDPDPLVNNATVYAYYDSNVAYASDTWTVDILHPAIDVIKSANATKAYAGDIIEYTIVVKNTGDCPLYNVNVTDTLQGNIWTGTLDVGESKTFTLTYTVKVGDPDPLVNTATASGKDVLGKMVTATDTATVDLIAKICGYKFYDANLNGTLDNGEMGLGGWTIQLFKWNETAWDWVANATTGPDGSYCFDGLDAGVYVVKEVAQQYWRCTTGSSITVDLKSGEISGNNNFGNAKIVTRTQGFWATHPDYTWSVWSTETIGSTTIDTDGKLFGAFWSNIAYTSNGKKRTLLDQARMQLLQQLVAAMLNVKAFGDDDLGTGATLIAAGKRAFAGTDRAAILSIAAQLEAFNKSGDNLPLPPGVNPGPADPEKAQATADIGFWDSLL
jgi:uncharacterized repeat protein (TIGR01451 family)